MNYLLLGLLSGEQKILFTLCHYGNQSPCNSEEGSSGSPSSESHTHLNSKQGQHSTPQEYAVDEDWKLWKYFEILICLSVQCTCLIFLKSFIELWLTYRLLRPVARKINWNVGFYNQLLRNFNTVNEATGMNKSSNALWTAKLHLHIPDVSRDDHLF